MKTLFFLLITFSASAQFKLDGREITFKADTMTVKQAFDFLRFALPLDTRYIKIVEKDSVVYWQTNYVINRLLKRRAYTVVNGKVKLVRI
jgi:hypothetical protein